MESTELDYRFGNDHYRISVAVIVDASQGRKMYRPEIVIEKNISDLDAEETRRVQVDQLFNSAEKAQRFASSHAKKLIEAGQLPPSAGPNPAVQLPSDL